MKATLFSSSISANLGNSGEAMVEIHKYSVKQDQLATTRSIHTSRGETLHLLPAAGWGAVSLIRQLREREQATYICIHARTDRAIL